MGIHSRYVGAAPQDKEGQDNLHARLLYTW